uniref:Uncharacterized protein n=1 Tax=Malurus cyaneus samueli TaxID=2593467 RepID=A0A8C5TRQ9_9PASS
MSSSGCTFEERKRAGAVLPVLRQVLSSRGMQAVLLATPTRSLFTTSSSGTVDFIGSCYFTEICKCKLKNIAAEVVRAQQEIGNVVGYHVIIPAACLLSCNNAPLDVHTSVLGSQAGPFCPAHGGAAQSRELLLSGESWN